ncbi:MAG: malto-oligosyltrehalose trehalohydrolase [Solirubrobacteraceae bacterium]
MSAPGFPWERPLGSRPLGDGTAEFRVWAPRAESIALRIGRHEHALDDAGYGIYEADVDVRPGDQYWYVVDGRRLPDPCSRSQPKGLRGPSSVLDITPAERSAAPGSAELVIYELHIGTFTAEGTFEAAAEHLGKLAEIGVTAIELMPVAEFPGHHGWGYDGVYISAPHSAYGGPTGLAKLVAAAHEHGLEVILDVVYNHVGASGVKALDRFGPYFTSKYETPWGDAINFDGADSDPVREWVLQSAEGWIRDYNIDGLRLDAIHAIYDSSADHIVAEIVRRVHAVRDDAWVIAESGLNDPRVMRAPELGGYGCNAAWADDFHHALRTVITDERDGYYAEFGRISQLAKAFHRPHVHDGNYSEFRHRRFGAAADDVAPRKFVVFSQNHDQVGNRAFGDRLPERVRPLAAFCTLLAPFVPMLFMGEEYGETAPFQFFSDHIDKRIADATRDGRRREFAAFAEFEEDIPDPQDPATFERSKLTRERNPRLAELYAQLLVERRRLPPGDAHEIEFDEQQRWLRVQRGPFEILCNFSDEPRRVPCAGTSVQLSTHEPPQPIDGLAELPPMSGALVR